MPAEAKLSLPGWALASAISSFMSLAGTLLATTSISGTVVDQRDRREILRHVVGHFLHASG